MFDDTFKSDRYAVKPFYRGAIIDDPDDSPFTRKQKIEFLKNLYRFYRLEAYHDLMIEEDATIDEAITLIIGTISGSTMDVFEIKNEKMFLASKVKIDYDSGCIPIKPFINERKNKSFFKFLVRILAYLVHKGVIMFDTRALEFVETDADYYIERVRKGFNDDEDRHWYFAAKVLKNFIRPMETLVYKDVQYLSYAFGKPVVKLLPADTKRYYYYKKKFPDWKQFLEDAIKVIRQDFYFHELSEANITEEIADNGYLPLDEMWHFTYEWPMGDVYLEDSPFDNQIDWWKRSSSEANGYWGIPYVSCTITDKLDGKHRKKLDAAENFFKLFTTDYECLR
jgi:hypothetical protein